MKLHRFNQNGMDAFNRYLDALKNDPAQEVPWRLLDDQACAIPVDAESPEMERRTFSTRMEAGRHLHAVLTQYGIPRVEADAPLWAWLTLFYFDSVCPVNGGKRDAGDRARYVPVSSSRRYYRHLLAGPYRIYHAHRENPDAAMVLLCGPLDTPGEIVEQLCSRQEIITNPQAVELATKLYFDGSKRTPRRGAGSKGKGSARRLADVFNQLDLTWDLMGMASDSLSRKLPKEFDRFKAKAA